MPTVGLSMIVKDEAHVIVRCLDSLQSLIDGAVIVDTGSTDGTQNIIRDYFARNGIHGELIEEPWRDFAHNRSSALAALRSRANLDYALVMDADDVLAFEPGFDAGTVKDGLSADVHDVAIHHGPTVYLRPLLFSNRRAFRFRSVLHEYLVVPPDAQGRTPAPGLRVVYGGDGRRSRDPGKYAGDATLLEQALAAEADPFLRARYTFYLAQSYRDCGQGRPAIHNYLRRADLGFWDQEVFESLHNAGRLMADQGESTEAVLTVLERASAAVPERVEALHAAALVCRIRGESRRGLAAAVRGLGAPRPESGLFLRPWVYDWGLLDEFAVNAHWAGRDVDCLIACSLILIRAGLDQDTRERVRSNRDAAHDRLVARGSPWAGLLSEGLLPRVAVVTPYAGESAAALRRCVGSVKRQTVAADHIVVAGGEPQDWLDPEVAHHVRAGPGVGAAAARAMGGLLAASGGYAALCFLDPDAWYDDDHVERCLLAALAVGLDACGVVAASRRFHRPDLSVLPLDDEPTDAFVDASCYMVLPPGHGLLGAWALVPGPLEPVADRVFFMAARAAGHVWGRTRHATVNAAATYAATYHAAGEATPPDARALPAHEAHRAWIDVLPPDAVDLVRRRLRIDIRDLYRPGRRAGADGDG